MTVGANISLGAIMNTAASALQSNQTALRVTSNNIANINTEGYHRRQVEFGPRLTGDRLTGVAVEDVRRIADEFLAREAVDATSAVGRMDVVSSYFSRVQDLIGSIKDGSSIGARISSAMTALQQLSVDPSSTARRNSALSSLTSTLSALSGMASGIQSLRQDANTQLNTDVRNVNELISQIYDLNRDIKTAVARNDTQSGLVDQRDKAISDLSKYLDIRTYEQSDGRVYVSLTDGTGLITDISSKLQYASPTAVSTTTVFPSITLQRYNPEGDNDIGPPAAIEGRVSGGEIRGLLDMRDSRLPDLAEQLGQIAGAFADEINAIHNNSTAVPPPASLTGVNSGLFSTDPLNFTGIATIAVVDQTGALVQKLDIDTSSLATVDDLVNAINAGLSGNATASFTNGVLSISANNAGQGVSMLQDPANPALRGGHGLSQFFGLNNLVTASSPSSFATGVLSTDAHGLNPGGTTEFVLRGTDGAILKSFSVSVGGSTVVDMLTMMDTAAGGFATFALDGNGSVVMTPAAAYSGARLEIKNDTTSRGATGVSFSQFFGLGTAMRQNQAMGMAVRSDIARNGSKLALAQLDTSASSVPGDFVLGTSDNRGALGLANAANALHSFDSTGGLASGTLSLNDYIAQVAGLHSDLANAAEDERVNRLNVKEEVVARRADREGVNLDEELSNMMIYQQAYNASARIMTVVQQMFDTLLQAV
ncbi:MAG: flagellar hook-associated protein FlgK [Micropepsaceae bacterium]